MAQVTFPQVAQRVPVGEAGRVKVSRSPCNETVTLLSVDGQICMSDDEFLHQTNAEVVRRAHGHVLLGGLGLGLILPPILAKPEVKHVTVLEYSADVAELVGQRYCDPKLTIAVADVFTWVPSFCPFFDTIWMDIWPSLSIHDLPEVARLYTRYRMWMNTSNPNHWMGFWPLAVLNTPGCSTMLEV